MKTSKIIYKIQMREEEEGMDIVRGSEEMRQGGVLEEDPAVR